MRDEEYCEVMLEAYRDVLSEILNRNDIVSILSYLREQIEFHVRWQNGESVAQTSLPIVYDEN